MAADEAQCETVAGNASPGLGVTNPYGLVGSVFWQEKKKKQGER